MNGRKSLGARGEELAVEHLKAKGLRILQRGYRSPFGEADIVARDGEDVVFVEVKTRAGASHGPAEEAVGPAKQERLGRIAQAWLEERGLADARVRFDVVAVQDGEVRHHRDAFRAEGWTR
ncbi:MAG: YraN family protein [Elusimicrobiota bacterium]|jgi:putative endonuclease